MTINIKSVQNMGYESYLTKDYKAGTDTTITVYDATKLPAAPNSIVISSLDKEDSIIVKYNAVSGNVLTVDTIIHYNRQGAESTKYPRGCIAYKEFSDTVSGGGGGSGGTDNYNLLSNKPQINGVQLMGNKTLNDIGVYSKTEVDGLVGAKQNILVSGTNIKTIDGNSVLGSGNLVLPVKPHHASHELGGADEIAIHATQVTAGQLDVARIPYLDASKVTTGVFDIGRIPPTALNNLVKVANDTARFALTPTDVAKGDSVYVISTEKLYLVVDTTKLSEEAGYLEYDASVDWTTVTGKPTTFPSSFAQITGNVSDNSPLTTALNTKVNKFWGVTEAGKVLKVGADGYVTADTGGGGGTTDYSALTNKPKISNVELNGNVSLGDIGAFKSNWGTTYNGKVIKIVDGIATPVDGTASAVAFADITGQPSDNSALNTVLNDKLSKSGHTTDIGKIVKVGTTGNLEFANNVADSVAFANITGNVSDNTALTAALNARVPLSATSEAISGFGVDASGNVYVDLL